METTKFQLMIHEIFALRRRYAPSIGTYIATFRYNLSDPTTKVDGPDSLSRIAIK
jgi:hypothetical protein